MDECALNLQNECAKDSHPPNEQADCKELFAGVEKPPAKVRRLAGISSLFSMFVLVTQNRSEKNNAVGHLNF